MSNINLKFEEFIEEGKKIVLKRQYTENHPAITVGKSAKVRNKILEAIADGKITQEEFDQIIKEYSKDSSKWMKRNAKFFNVSEDGIALSAFGKKALSAVVVNEESVTENYEVIYSDGISAMKKFRTEAQALDFMKQTIASNNKLRDIAVYKPGMYSTTETDKVVAFWGDGSYLDNVSKKDPKLAAKKLEESVVAEARKPKFWDSIATMNAIKAWQDGEFDPYDADSVVKWETEQNGGITPKPSFGTAEVIKYAIAIGKKPNGEKLEESAVICEATVEMDAMDPDNKDFLKFLKKNRVKIIDKKMEGPGGGTPVITMEGTRKDLEKVLADSEYGWDDPDLAEYIEEGRKFVAAAKKAKDAGDEEFEFNGKKFPVTIKEGNAFGAARAKAIAAGKKEFTVDGETYPVEDVDKEDKENAKDFAKESFVYESFSSFVESLNASELNEAFKSMKLAQLLVPANKSRWNPGIAQDFYNYAKVKLDQIEDHDLLEVDPRVAYKQKGGTKVKFFIIDNVKQSPYTEDSYDGRVQPGIIAILNGDNEFMGSSYVRYGGESGKKLKVTDKSDSIGVDKRRKGYGATGLSSPKRIADFADRAVVIDIDILRQRYSAEEQRAARATTKKGAIAFKSDKDFKNENMARYREILANKAAALPLDKMVEEAIDKLTAQIKAGLASGDKTKYGEIKIGENKRGSAVKMRDAANHMNNILDYYDRYVNYVGQAEIETAEWGRANSYYDGESKKMAKEVKDAINKIDTFDYAW